MTPQELLKDAQEAISQRTWMSLVIRNKRPKGFPRGELLCETPNGNVYSFDPHKVVAWLNKNDLITNEEKQR